MELNDFALLASDTARTKAYLQMMVKEDLRPAMCIVYVDDRHRVEAEADSYSENRQKEEYFALREPLIWTIRKAGLAYTIVEKKDINDSAVEAIINQTPQNYIIYSGYGGYILKPELFKTGKRFIHIHAGMLPAYRGSTTAYYSMIQENYIGATAIFLNEGIDEGDIITSERYPRPPKGVNIDILYEPYVRSQVLKKVLQQYRDQGELNGKRQEKESAQTYFIIHPVIKHLELMRP